MADVYIDVLKNDVNRPVELHRFLIHRPDGKRLQSAAEKKCDPVSLPAACLRLRGASRVCVHIFRLGRQRQLQSTPTIMPVMEKKENKRKKKARPAFLALKVDSARISGVWHQSMRQQSLSKNIHFLEVEGSKTWLGIESSFAGWCTLGSRRSLWAPTRSCRRAKALPKRLRRVQPSLSWTRCSHGIGRADATLVD